MIGKVAYNTDEMREMGTPVTLQQKDIAKGNEMAQKEFNREVQPSQRHGYAIDDVLYDPYLKRIGMGEMKGYGIEGGWVGSTLLLAPHVLGMIPGVVNTIKKIFGKGTASKCGGALKDLIEGNMDMIKQMNSDIVNAKNPKEMWQTLGTAKKLITKGVLKKLGEYDKNKMIGNKALKQKLQSATYPKSFRAIVEKTKGGAKPMGVYNTTMPLVRWGLSKILKGKEKLADEVYKTIKERFRGWKREKEGGKINFKKIGAFFKKAITSALPFIKKIANVAASSDVVRNTLKSLITKLPGNMQMDPSIVDTMADAVKTITASGFSSPPQAAGFTKPPQRARGGEKKKNNQEMTDPYQVELKIF